MSNEQKNEVFSYSYSARQQAEIRKIREKYTPRETDNMTRLKQLDEGVNRKATTAALTIGIPSCLLLGLGMSCCMVWGGAWFVPGILIGLLGMLGSALAYPAYQRILKKERERIAPEIIRLTDELLK